MKPSSQIITFGLLFGLFSAFKLVEHLVVLPTFFHDYFEDIIALPLILKSAQLIIQVTLPGQQNFRIAGADIVAITVLFSIYFEAYLPGHDTRFTADWMDVLAYASGAVFYWSLLNPPVGIRALTQSEKFG